MKVHALLAVAGTAHAFSGITGRHLPASTVGGLSRTCLPRSPALSMQVQKAQTSIFVDEEAMRQEKAFPLTPEDMIARSKAFLESRGGFGADPDLIADDFQFMGPVVGPLGKDEFLSAIGSVDMKTAFPDFQGEFYNFNVDPFEGNRVWYIARGRGTNTGPLPPFAPTATNKPLVNPPQACSLSFDESGLVTKYTIGYIMDRTVGNTGGLGGLYGVLYAIGRPLPFPEARPWQMSKRYKLFNKLGGFLQRLAERKKAA